MDANFKKAKCYRNPAVQQQEMGNFGGDNLELDIKPVQN